MIDICWQPSQVYKMNTYRKQSRNQWSRDDPAFVVILTGFLAVSALAYGVTLKHISLISYIHVILETVGIQLLGSGFAVATIGWWFSNKFLLVHHAHR
jgi:hypothetical protein